MKKVLCLSVLVLLALSVPATTAPAAGTARTWTVIVGGGIQDTSVVANAFFPRTLEIAVGDSVKFDFQEPWTIHTVTFPGGKPVPDLLMPAGKKLYLNPNLWFKAGGSTYNGTGFRNSGVAPQGPNVPHFSYTLTFTKAGTYDYSCPLHGPAMSGKIVVKDTAAGSPAAALAQAKKEQAATLSAGQAAYATWSPEKQTEGVVLSLEGDAKTRWTNLRFSREPVVVKRGSTVTWIDRDPFEIHTVTFTTGGKDPADFVVLETQKGAPPKVLANPQQTTPTASKTFDGTAYANSGILFPPGTPDSMPKKWSLTFTKPGKYTYYCAIHAPWGMKGTIIVE